MKYIKMEIFVSSNQDSYEKGESIEGGTFDRLETLTFETLEKVLPYIKETYGEPVVFEDRLLFSRLETATGDAPNEYQMQKWKDGAMSLYATSYDFYVSEVEERKIENAQLVKTFSNLEEV